MLRSLRLLSLPAALALAALGLLPACGPERAALLPAGGSLDIGLDGQWTVGGVARALPLDDLRGPLTLTRTIELPADWDEDARTVLRANALGWRVTASVNGRVVGSDAGGLRPLAIALTGALRAGTNTLALQLDGPRADTIVPGVRIERFGRYTYRQPAPDEVMLRGEIWLDVDTGPSVDDIDVEFADGTLTARARVSGADGEPLALTVVRDGVELARFPPATVQDGVATGQIAWSGPTWTLGGGTAPFLQYLVAALPDGTRRQLRFAARDARRAGRGLALGGEPLYLAVQRYVPRAADPRDELARLAALYARNGLNGLELHAMAHADGLLAAADELGFPVVQTPRCDGRRRDGVDIPPDATWAAFIEEGNARMAASGRDHPSVLLWNLEAQQIPQFPTLYRPFEGVGAPFVDSRESQGFHDEGYAQMRATQPLPAWIAELAFQARIVNGQTLEARVEALLREHRPWGIGITMPHLLVEDQGARSDGGLHRAYLDALPGMLARAVVRPLPTGVRRGPAGVRVTVTRAGKAAPGAVIVLDAPGQAPVAGAADARGVVDLQLDYAGGAEVSALGGAARAAVSLTPGRYEGGGWRPSVTAVNLALDTGGS